ncbi:MAG: Sec-independent protein translocase protein TatB [Pseudohongiella sp.]|nr:Sec-independent protein translocase protein TatB [Pseudohongiella sp.]
MFDISFIELLVIFVVALLVLGPEKLPDAVRTGALWLGRAKRSFGKVKAEIEQQLNADDIRRQLHNESILADIEKARKSADQLVKDTRKELDKTQDGINKTISSAIAAPVPVVTNSSVEGLPTFIPETPSEASAPEPATAMPAPDASDPTIESAPTEKQPVQDFYNNPPSGLVSMKNGKLTAYVAPAPASEPADGKKD